MSTKVNQYFFGDETTESFETFLFVKRPGRRQEELNELPFEELDSWKWWLTVDELLSEIPFDRFGKEEAIALISGPPGLEMDAEIAIRYFCYCHQSGIYPPDWVMNELYKNFSKWLIENYNGNNRSLDDFFKLKGTKRPDQFKKKKEMEGVSLINVFIQNMREHFKFKYYDALDVASKLCDVDSSDNPKSDVIEKNYKEWLKSRDYDVWKERHKKNPSPEDLKKYLRNIPPGFFEPKHLEKYPHLKDYIN